MKGIISNIEKTVIPSKGLTNTKNKISKLVFDLVKDQVEKFPEVLDVEFGGSFAKDTWLSKGADIDIFIRFKKSTSEEKFEKIAKMIGFESLKKYSPYVRYSEHPYVEAKIKDTKINVVPFYDVKMGEWKSAADRSPFHARFMKKSLTSEMKKEVRILKTFLKANGIYGAEIAKQGFSGYVSEVLILNFGSFENVIKSISTINENQTIGKTSKKFETLLVIIDPIDSNRNLAAAISDENIGRFILSCRAFNKNPSEKFFKEKISKISKKHWENILVVKFNFKARSPDIIWGQIKRTASTLSTQLKLGGFNVLRSKSYVDPKNYACLFFLLESIKISNTYSKTGPDFFREEGSTSFILKNLKNTELMWIGNDRRIISLEKREHVDASKFMREFLKKNIQTGIPKGLQNDFKKGFEVFVGNRRLSKSIKEAGNDLVSTDGSILHFN